MAAAQPDKALADFNRAIKLQPDYPRAYSNRSIVYLRKGRIGLAVIDYKRAGGSPTRVILSISIILVVILALVLALYRLFLRRRDTAQRSLC
jgi:tetratricopeptide (TPR) repeat protein